MNMKKMKNNEGEMRNMSKSFRISKVFVFTRTIFDDFQDLPLLLIMVSLVCVWHVNVACTSHRHSSHAATWVEVFSPVFILAVVGFSSGAELYWLHLYTYSMLR